MALAPRPDWELGMHRKRPVSYLPCPVRAAADTVFGFVSPYFFCVRDSREYLLNINKKKVHVNTNYIRPGLQQIVQLFMHIRSTCGPGNVFRAKGTTNVGSLN